MCHSYLQGGLFSQVLPLPRGCEGSLASDQSISCASCSPWVQSAKPPGLWVPCGCAASCYFCYFQPVAQLSDWIVEMQNSGDTNTEHLLPDQPDEQLDAKGASLYCHRLCAAFLKEQRRRKQQDSCSGAGVCCAQGLLGHLDLLVFWIQLISASQEHVPALVVPNSVSSDTEGPRAVGIPWPFPACGVSRWFCPWMGTQQLGTSILWPSHRK